MEKKLKFSLLFICNVIFLTKKNRMAILYFKNSLKYNQYFIRCYLLILLTVIEKFLKV